MNKLYLPALMLLFTLSCAAVTAEPPQSPAGPPEPFNVFYPVPPAGFERLNGLQEFVKPVRSSLSVDFGPHLLKVNASYLEERERLPWSADDFADMNPRRYVHVLGTTSFGGSQWTGEGELTYSAHGLLSPGCACTDWPRTLRLGIKTRWSRLTYGAEFRSTEKGFVSFSRMLADRARDEGQFWGEYHLGPFNIRGSLGESWEESLDHDGLRLTRAAGTSIRLDRSIWGGTFASSYGLVDQGTGLHHEMTVFSSSLSGFYRPLGTLSMAPSFMLVEERQTDTGLRTGTPIADFSIVYTPYKDAFKLTGGTSYRRSFDNIGLTDVTTVGARAAVDWKLGKFLGLNDTLSFNLNYNRRREATATGSDDELLGLLQLKITGY